MQKQFFCRRVRLGIAAWRTVLWGFVRQVLFKFDAERAHHGVVKFLGLSSTLAPRGLRWLGGVAPEPRKGLSGVSEVFGLPFGSRVGLAAGFDKNAEAIQAFPALGFGFAEIGTVTPLPQLGNPAPRLFRDVGGASLFNRMGFNNLGADRVAANLRRARPALPAYFPVGVNIGKGRDTAVQDAADDYAQAVRPFRGLVDFVVINVSSPNTQGLRSLQTVEFLEPIVGKVLEQVSQWQGLGHFKRTPPVLLKLAPELSVQELAPIFTQGEKWGISGWVLTNTLAGTWTQGRQRRGSESQCLSGGWSGAKLTELSRERLREARQMTHLPMISVGGICSVEEAATRFKLGADLIQIYSGWIFNGPSFPSQITHRLRQIALS